MDLDGETTRLEVLYGGHLVMKSLVRYVRLGVVRHQAHYAGPVLAYFSAEDRDWDWTTRIGSISLDDCDA